MVNIPNSMTVLPELLPYSIEMALRRLTGIYNFCNPGAISHNQVLELYRDYIDPDFKWANFSIEEQAKVITAARSNNELSPHKMWKEPLKNRCLEVPCAGVPRHVAHQSASSACSLHPWPMFHKDSLVEYVFKPLQTEKSKARMAKK